MGRQGGDGRELEKSGDGQGALQLLADRGVDAEHEEGVAAEIEEIVSSADFREAEGPLPDGGEALFHGGARCGAGPAGGFRAAWQGRGAGSQAQARKVVKQRGFR
jgi:hypothetical protein